MLLVVMLYNVWKTIQLAPKGSNQETRDEFPRFVPKSFVAELSEAKSFSHRMLEGMPMILTVLAVVAIGIGSVISLAPMVATNALVEANYDRELNRPYTPLQLAGRDIYVREGCYTCHSQMILKTVGDVLRYGQESKIEDSMYDHPFQWGSRRIGPDLAREGKRYNHLWHFRHMRDPREVVAGSVMPTYPWLYKSKVDFGSLTKRLSAMKTLGVPYSDEEVVNADANARAEADGILKELSADGVTHAKPEQEIIALIAYLQKLGQRGGQ